jgi:hypothetical protein
MFLLDILKNTVIITVFVLIMMILVEYISVQSKGKWNSVLKKNPHLQILFAALIGVTPGCMGGYAVVSLYTHRVIGFAALIAALIASTGDEAFIMYSLFPKQAFILTIVILIIAIVTGYLVWAVIKTKNFIKLPEAHIRFYENKPDCVSYESHTVLSQLKHIVWQRVLFLSVGIAVVLYIILAYSHDSGILPELVHSGTASVADVHANHSHSEWGAERITLLVVNLLGVFIMLTVSDHFLIEHLWKHVIKKHLLRLFLWTFGAFTVLYFLNQFVDIEQWIVDNKHLILLAAVLVGIIPESGPHIIFATMFASHIIPFSVLLANSIVQDGHSAIPLLAESRKSFIYAKILNALIALTIGFGLGLFGL